MNILTVDEQSTKAGTFDAEDGVPSFQVTNNDGTLEEALAWVAGQETMALITGGLEGTEEEGQFYTEEIPVEPGNDGYYDVVSEFLYDYGYYLDLTAELEAVAG